jgi:hypothetical protein
LIRNCRSKHLQDHAYRLKPLACFGLFGFSPEGGTRTAGVRKPPDCAPPNTFKSPEGDTRTAGVRKPPDRVFSIGLMIVE